MQAHHWNYKFKNYKTLCSDCLAQIFRRCDSSFEKKFRPGIIPGRNFFSKGAVTPTFKIKLFVPGKLGRQCDNFCICNFNGVTFRKNYRALWEILTFFFWREMMSNFWENVPIMTFECFFHRMKWKIVRSLIPFKIQMISCLFMKSKLILTFDI